MILKNIRLFAKNYRGMLILLFISQVIAISVILFSYGVYKDSQTRIDDDKSLASFFTVAPGQREETDTSLLYGKAVKEGLISVLAGLEDIFWYGEVDFLSKGHSYPTNEEFDATLGNYITMFSLEEGQIVHSEYFLTNIAPKYSYTFTDEEMRSGEMICVLETKDSTIQKVRVGEHEYRVVGMLDTMSGVSRGQGHLIPFMSIGDTMRPAVIYLRFSRPLRQSEYELLSKQFDAVFGDVFPNWEANAHEELKVDEVQVLENTIVGATMLSIMAAVAVCTGVYYFLWKRTPMTAVYQICGSTPFRTALVYFGELGLLLGLTGGLGVALFFLAVRPWVTSLFDWDVTLYTNGKWGILLAIYALLLFVICFFVLVVNLRRSPKEVLRRCA